MEVPWNLISKKIDLGANEFQKLQQHKKQDNFMKPRTILMVPMLIWWNLSPFHGTGMEPNRISLNLAVRFQQIPLYIQGT